MTVESRLPVVGLLVIYYDSYLQAAVRNFSTLLRRGGGEPVIVVIDNSPLDRRQQMPCPVAAYVRGDNRLREFSAWNQGLAMCREMGWLDRPAAFVFANDTFCHHNRYGWLTRQMLSRQIRDARMQDAAPTLWGERHGLGVAYSIGGMAADFWVSTYLFGVHPNHWRDATGLIPESLVDCRAQQFDELFDAWQASENLRRHVLSWLGLAGPNMTRWYGAKQPAAAGHAAMLTKAACILAEKYVAARGVGEGLGVEDVFSSPAWRQIRRLESRPGDT